MPSAPLPPHAEPRGAHPLGGLTPGAAAGPAFGGFRPFQLDDLLAWALNTARQRQWDPGLVQCTVLDCWLERAEAIRQWQRRLREEPADRLLVAGIGSQHDWQQRCGRCCGPEEGPKPSAGGLGRPLTLRLPVPTGPRADPPPAAR